MGNFISALFADPASLDNNAGGFIQVLILCMAYGYILTSGSNMISDGSELLLLIPSLAGIVGSVVLPVLGAVPDAAIVLFSGLGPDAQTQLEVGVGALAGSTIMLLTVPWFLSIMAGRVTLDQNGKGNYRRAPGAQQGPQSGVALGEFTKLVPGTEYSLFRSGVNVGGGVKMSGIVMLITSLSYVVIQGPAFAQNCYDKDDGGHCSKEGERWWAFAGMILCIVLFIVYLVLQVVTSNSDSVVDATVQKVRLEAISKNMMSLRGVFAAVINIQSKASSGNSESLLQGGPEFRSLVREFFKKYDKNRDGVIDGTELRLLLSDFNEDINVADKLMSEIDTDHNGTIDFEEFVAAMQKFVTSDQPRLKSTVTGSFRLEEGRSALEEEEDEGEEEEDEEVPEDLAHLSPAQQRTRILLRSAWMMGVGTILVLAFSDPMVDVLSSLGDRIHVSPFYTSFVLAPLASNASELIASYNYALKKTQKTMTISFQALEGAACMNNTLCLGIFLALVFFKNLEWIFSAETIAILFVEICMFFFSLKKTHRFVDAIIVASFYPLSLVIVAVLEGPVGLN